MSEINCPKCGEVIKIDETSYAKIVRQVHDQEFTRSVQEKLELLEVKKGAEFTNEKQKIEKEFEEQIRALKNDRDDRDQVIERLKSMGSELSTKMIGETLEQHCEIEFDKLRSLAFPKAYFEKDNDARGGSKGDYIFRDYDENGTEIVSIMFEMKNENQATTTKKKNEDFLKELDKDRSEKNCEYAVLVSRLELDNDLYNSGIVDKSHRYPQMYVVRPQFFIPIITILRNASMRSLEIKNQLAVISKQNIDVTNFEADLEEFKTGFSYNYDLAKKKFDTAIEHIDRSIASLERTKKDLLSSENQLRLANNKAQDVTIKRLTRKNTTMASKFEEIKKI